MVRPADPGEIRPYLCIGSQLAAKNLELLLQAGVTHILNVAKEIPCYHLSTPRQTEEEKEASEEGLLVHEGNTGKKTGSFIYLHLQLEDDWEEDLTEALAKSKAFIDEAREWRPPSSTSSAISNTALGEQKDSYQGGKVFVHCQAGISRSATCVLSYLMQCEEQLTLREAFHQTRAARSCIGPNGGFMAKLIALDEQVHQQLQKPYEPFSLTEYHIQCLVDMGFALHKARIAVARAGSSFDLAVELCLSNIR